YTVHVVTSGRVRDVLFGRNGAGRSVDIRRILQAIVETTEFMLVYQFQKISSLSFRPSGDVARRVVVAAVLRGGVTVIAPSVGQRSVPAHVVILHLTVSIASLPAAFDKQFYRHVRQLQFRGNIVHPAFYA